MRGIAQWVASPDSCADRETLVIHDDPKVTLVRIDDGLFLANSPFFTGTAAKKFEVPDMASAKREVEKLLRDGLIDSIKRYANTIIYHQDMLASLVSNPTDKPGGLEGEILIA